MDEKRSTAEEYDEAVKKVRQTGKLVLKLYITGMTPNSVRAVRNIKNICQKNFKPEEIELEIIDVYQNAALARGEDIIATPTLIKKSPGMESRLVGDLSDEQKVLRILSIMDV